MTEWGHDMQLSDQAREAVSRWLREYECEVVCKVLLMAGAALAHHMPIDNCDPEGEFIGEIERQIAQYTGAK